MPRRVLASDPSATAIKAIEILECLIEASDGLGLNEVARRTGMGRTSAFRLLAALERTRLAVRDPVSRRYRPTLKLLDWSATLLERLDLPEVAKPHLQRLCESAGETTHLGVLEGWQVVFVAEAESPNPIRLRAGVGFHAPSHCTSLGKVLLAGLAPERLDQYLEEYELTGLTERTITSPSAFREHLAVVQSRGYAVDDEEHRAGICCVGAGIREHRGTTVAAVSVSGPAFRMKGRRVQQLAAMVRAAATAVSADLGWAGDEPAAGARGS